VLAGIMILIPRQPSSKLLDPHLSDIEAHVGHRRLT
jgi:hypothetical protein